MPAASCCATRACSMSTPAHRWVRATVRWRLRCRSAPPSGRSPTRTSRPCARGSSPRWMTWVVSCVVADTADFPQAFAEGSPRVLVAGATGFAGALAAHLLWRHPRFELIAVTGRSEVGRRLDDLYPRYRVPLELVPLELERYERL